MVERQPSDDDCSDASLEAKADRLGFLIVPEAKPLSPISHQFTGGTLPEIPGYVLIEEIGSGGSSIVYLARRRSSDERVAVKVFSGTVYERQNLVRFRREIESLKRLDHPNIVKLLDYGISKNVSPYIVLQYVDGRCIDEYVESNQSGYEEISRLLESVCCAVHSAHEFGIIHRDLKPSNILVDGNGVPYVTDFGLAKMISEMRDANDVDKTQTGSILGTLNYLSPEQMFGLKSQSAESIDVFGIGCVLYRLLSGKAPFEFQNIVDAAQTYFQRLPVRVDTERRLGVEIRVPDPLAKICLKCLAAEPSLRFDSAAEVGRQLTRYINGKSVHVGRTSLLHFASGVFRKRPWLGVASFVGAVCILIASIVFYMQWRRSSQLLAHSQQLSKSMKVALLDLGNQVRQQEDDPNTASNRRDQLVRISHHLDVLLQSTPADLDMMHEKAVTEFKLGRIEHYLGHRDLETEHYINAFAGFEAIEHRDPSSREALFGQFHSLISMGRWERSFDVISKLRLRDPENLDYTDATVTTTLHLANRDLGFANFEQSKRWLTAGLDDTNLRLSLRQKAKRGVIEARLCIADGNWGQAEKILQQALSDQLKLEPLSSSVDSEAAEYLAYLRVGFLIAALRKDKRSAQVFDEEASRFFDEAQQRFPDLVDIYWKYYLFRRDTAAFYTDQGMQTEFLDSIGDWESLLNSWPSQAKDGFEYRIASLYRMCLNCNGNEHRTEVQNLAYELSNQNPTEWLPALIQFDLRGQFDKQGLSIADAELNPILRNCFLSWIEKKGLYKAPDKMNQLGSSASNYFLVSRFCLRNRAEALPMSSH